MWPPGVTASALNGKYTIDSFDPHGANQWFAKVALTATNSWHHPAGHLNNGQAIAGEAIVFSQVDVIPVVYLQRRMKPSTDWTAEIDLLLLPENYPQGELPANVS